MLPTIITRNPFHPHPIRTNFLFGKLLLNSFASGFSQFFLPITQKTTANSYYIIIIIDVVRVPLFLFFTRNFSSFIRFPLINICFEFLKISSQRRESRMNVASIRNIGFYDRSSQRIIKVNCSREATHKKWEETNEK